MHGDVITYRQNVDKLAEQQQSKYLDLYTILPSEISMQLAEVSLALGAIEDQVLYNTNSFECKLYIDSVTDFIMRHWFTFLIYFSGSLQRERKSEN